MSRMPGATWCPSPNFRHGNLTPKFIIIHGTFGKYPGCRYWLCNPKAQVSAHFVVAKTGHVDQLVDTHDEAWAEAGGNPECISIEFETVHGEQLTSEQIASGAKIMSWVHKTHGTALVATDSPDGSGGVGWHGMGGQAWGGHLHCPGSYILPQRPAMIAEARKLAGLDQPAKPVDHDPNPSTRRVIRLTSPYMTGNDIREIQQELGLHVDGVYGPSSNQAVKNFQTNNHLSPDGIVGPATWAMLDRLKG